jgi:hypothetical protein
VVNSLQVFVQVAFRFVVRFRMTVNADIVLWRVGNVLPFGMLMSEMSLAAKTVRVGMFGL